MTHLRVPPVTAGVFVVVWSTGYVAGPIAVEAAGGPVGLALGVAGALCLSLGSLGQRWLPADLPSEWSATVQLGVSVPPLLLVRW